MRQLVTVLISLLIVAAAAASGLSARAADGGRAFGAGMAQGTAASSAWQPVNTGGFGDPQAQQVSALASFGTYLYAGTYNPSAGAQIFRASDGTTWTAVTQPGFGIAHDIAPPAILAMSVFNGRLYASTGWGDGPGQIWRSLNGTTWAPMVITGFSDPDTVDVTALIEYDGLLYAAAQNLITGAQIWRSYTGDNNSWTQVAPALPGTEPATVTALAVFDGALYAAVELESATPVQLWRTYGAEWTTVVDDGFGAAATVYSGGMAELGGYLYVGAGSSANGAQLWRSPDGVHWAQAITPSFGDPNNHRLDAVFVFQHDLYVSTRNPETGLELWRSADGTAWTQVNPDGFGDANNTGSNSSNASATFGDQFYIGTANMVSGGELWRLEQESGVALSSAAPLAGQAGSQVVYTLWITNTGSVTDTMDLTLVAPVWSATLSAPTVTLAAGEAASVTVSVAIPPVALPTASDQCTLRATSHHDSGIFATAVLTTVSTGLPPKCFLPTIRRSIRS